MKLRKVPEIKTISEDIGQLDTESNLSARLPCVLIDVEYSDCKNVSKIDLSTQVSDVFVTLKVACSIRNDKIDLISEERFALLNKLQLLYDIKDTNLKAIYNYIGPRQSNICAVI